MQPETIFSEWAVINHVVRGKGLGRLFSLLYINDFKESLQSFSSYLVFA